MSLLVATLSAALAIASHHPVGETRIVQDPVIRSLSPSASKLELCPWSLGSAVCSNPENVRLSLMVDATSSNNNELTYKYSVTDGKIAGKGSKVSWIFRRARVGTQKVTVEVTDRRGRMASASAVVVFEFCGTCDPPLRLPTIQMSCPENVVEGAQTVISARLTGDGYRRHLKFAWSISDGKIIRGFGTKTIKVDTKNAGHTITATVEVSGLDPAANRTASCTMRIGKM